MIEWKSDGSCEEQEPSAEEEEGTTRAKKKALRLLERMDRTEDQLRQKLLSAEFTPDETETAIAYVKSFGYLNDERYVRNYLESRQDKKSRRRLLQELQYQKGVSPELIEKACAELEKPDEKSLIRRELEKKHYELEACDEKLRQKLIASLLRKGFSMTDILSVMRE